MIMDIINTDVHDLVIFFGFGDEQLWDRKKISIEIHLNYIGYKMKNNIPTPNRITRPSIIPVLAPIFL